MNYSNELNDLLTTITDSDVPLGKRKINRCLELTISLRAVFGIHVILEAGYGPPDTYCSTFAGHGAFAPA